MRNLLDAYAEVAGADVIDQLRQLAAPLRGKKIVHVNSTRTGGGVAEILDRLVPLMQELGLDTTWEQIAGGDEFYQCTKGFHNGLQGQNVSIGESQRRAYEEANARHAEANRESLEAADVVFGPMPIKASVKIAPNRVGMSRLLWATMITLPSPRSALNHSAITAPITARGMETRKAAKR